MPASYPTGLPLPEVEAYTTQVEPRTIRTAVLGGYSRFRVVNQNAGVTYTAEIICEEDEAIAVETFYEVELRHGSEAFLLPIQTSSGFSERLVYFLQPPELQLLAGRGLWRVLMQLGAEYQEATP